MESVIPNLRPKFRGQELLLGLLISVFASSLAAKDCECKFSRNDFRAYGTNGVCGVFMYEKSTVCEVSFAAAGASPDIAAKIVGTPNSSMAMELSHQLLKQYFVYRQTGNRSPLSNPQFISESLPAMVGSVLFRESVVRNGVPIKELYSAAVILAEKMGERIADVFVLKAEPESGNLPNGTTYEIGEGFIELGLANSDDIRVRVVFFRPEGR